MGSFITNGRPKITDSLFGEEMKMIYRFQIRSYLLMFTVFDIVYYSYFYFRNFSMLIFFLSMQTIYGESFLNDKFDFFFYLNFKNLVDFFY